MTTSHALGSNIPRAYSKSDKVTVAQGGTSGQTPAQAKAALGVPVLSDNNIFTADNTFSGNVTISTQQLMASGGLAVVGAITTRSAVGASAGTIGLPPDGQSVGQCRLNGSTVVGVRSYGDLTGQTASIAQSSIYMPKQGFYRASIFIGVTTAATAGTISATIYWTDDVGATSSVVISGLSLVGTTRSSGSVVLYSNSSSVDFSTTLAGIVGSPQYSVRVRLEYLEQ